VSEPRRPVQEPLDVDAVRVIGVGTVLWFVGFVALLPFHARLAENGHQIWLWTCLAGWVLGLMGLPLCYRQRAAARRARQTRERR
jgi:Protein of unknown function (DUF2530)